MQSYKYALSLIMPVYNSALYLNEAIESIISQTVGFEKIQLIIVNDGSTDNSAEIIKKYAEKYPENILFIDKKNGGVASARNSGLEHAQGKYISFPDPDDTVSINAYKDILSFFEKNYDKTDVVSFPIYFFGDSEGEHPLNAKFKNGSRVIDLEDENEFQLHITSSVIKSEIARNIQFKKELVTSEDAEAILRALIDNPKLGVVSTARYNYRKHAGSLLSTATNKKNWYLPHLNYYFKGILNYAKEKNGCVPKFIQRALLYDLGWKLWQKKRPNCLVQAEVREFINEAISLLSIMDEELIRNSAIPQCVKQLALQKREGTLDISKCPITLEFVEDCGDKIKISARAQTLISHTPSGFFAYVNGSAVNAKISNQSTTQALLGEEISTTLSFDFEIEKSSLESKTTIYLAFQNDNNATITQCLELGKFFPIEKKYNSSFFALDDFLMCYEENSLVIERVSKKEVKKRNRVFVKELWKSNGFGERKAVLARILASIYKRLHKKPIWIFSDRLSTAGDSAEILFAHASRTKFKKAKCFYAIRKGRDYSRLKKYGAVINRSSLKYKILFLSADVIISSHAEDFVINPFDYYWQPYKDILTQKSFVFLQHGVTKDDLSPWLNKYNKNIKGFVCTSPLERDSILNGAYGYTNNELWLTGLARFDALESKAEKLITVMPTWRRYLVGNIDIATGEWKQASALENSKHLQFWNAFLNDERLLSALEKYGYKMLFVPHPNMKKICDFITTSPNVFVQKECDYRELYKRSALMISDYSSTVFDFAYLEKPIIYAQFDKDEFFSGAHSYERGYFDYEKNGFGKVTYTLDETVESVIQCIENECRCEQKYLDRINDFFAYRDKNNCKRILEKILGDKND